MKNDRYRSYLLSVLLVTLAFNTKDRLLFGLALEDIKTDLLLTDTQLGLLTGLAFAIFYAIAGIPISRLADRGNRVTIIAVSTAIWSGAVALCGFAGSFIQLLLIRIIVAVGEAGCIPPAHSLIADYYGRVERPRAIAIFQLGAPLSALIGYFLAGWLIDLYGWRVTFMLLGLPGIALASLIWLTLREPRCAATVEQNKPLSVDAESKHSLCFASDPPPSIREVVTVLWNIATFRHLLFGYAILAFFSSGIAQWHAAFFIRSYGMTTRELGIWFALIYGGLGLLGTYTGGVLAGRYAANNEPLQLKSAACAYCLLSLVSTGSYLSPDPYLAITLTGLAAIGTFAVSGPLFALIQTLVPARMRAMAVAIMFLSISLIGTGLGPLAAGMLSDGLRPWAGKDSLRYALMMLSPGYFWSAWHFWRASRFVTYDLPAPLTDSGASYAGDQRIKAVGAVVQ